MRISSIQESILFVLFAIEESGNKDAVQNTKLFKMINDSRSSKLHDTNFRASCHKLNENKLIDKYRCSLSFKLAWSLTELGKEKGRLIYINRTKESSAV
jgi:hypothetical protein